MHMREVDGGRRNRLGDACTRCLHPKHTLQLMVAQRWYSHAVPAIKGRRYQQH